MANASGAKPGVSISQKPPQAGYRARAILNPAGELDIVPDPNFDTMEHGLETVQINWYEDRVKVKFLLGGPAAITQAYMTGDGKDVILEIVPVTGH
jgi:hypothetical protein